MWKQLRIFESDLNMFYCEVDFRKYVIDKTVVIGFSSLFSLGLFVNSAEIVKIHFDYVFFLLQFATI